MYKLLPVSLWWSHGPLILMEKLKQNVVWFAHGERQMSWSSLLRQKGFRHFHSESKSLVVEAHFLSWILQTKISHEWYAKTSTFLWRCLFIKTYISRILWDFQEKRFPKLSIIKSADETDWICKKMGKIKCYFVTVKFINKSKHFIGFDLAFLWNTFKSIRITW